MRAAAPMFLYALALVPLLALLLVLAARRRRALLGEFGDAGPLARISRSVDPRRRRQKAILFLLGITFGLLALARPQFGAREVLVKRRGIDVVFAVDTSLSMLARDLPPSRFQRAKQEIGRVLDRLEGDRVALVAFAGSAYVQCPFTVDYGALRLFLENIAVGAAPKPGSDLAVAIERSASLFDPDEKKYKAVVLFSDGEALSGEAIAAAKRAGEAGVKILTVGVGTADGGVIPILAEDGGAGGVKRDENGEVVVTRLDEASLVEIGRATGGKYVPLGGSGDPGAEIADEIEAFEKKELTSRTAVQFEERHTWFSILAFLLLAADFLLPEGRRVARRPVGEGS